MPVPCPRASVPQTLVLNQNNFRSTLKLRPLLGRLLGCRSAHDRLEAPRRAEVHCTGGVVFPPHPAGLILAHRRHLILDGTLLKHRCLPYSVQAPKNHDDLVKGHLPRRNIPPNRCAHFKIRHRRRYGKPCRLMSSLASGRCCSGTARRKPGTSQRPAMQRLGGLARRARLGAFQVLRWLPSRERKRSIERGDDVRYRRSARTRSVPAGSLRGPSMAHYLGGTRYCAAGCRDSNCANMAQRVRGGLP